MAVETETLRADAGAASAVIAATADGVAQRIAAGSAVSDLIETLPSPAYDTVKRVFDIVASVIGLVIFGSVLPLLALAIKLDSPGSVFYAQERVGMNRRRRRHGVTNGGERRKVLQPGRPFRIFKLRTMCNNAEAGGPQWAKQGDKRVTRVGRFLRKTRLDELPQLWNVLRGDMSLIGPRPERLCFIRQLENDVPFYHDRLLVKPGLTGLAQVRNGYDESVESVCRKVEFDREYIRRSGPLTDVGILLETVRVVLKGEGAR
ncbi:MAG TPA: sugar transferase [Candidatus Krumholzibacteria bacterium]|nr:sugar transferase [Candidatus Krumholzibacteria bacterium]HPD71529.1 sugar transferase [Candidatus Krumholzibacteria bacterium]HRY41538.1 sugar transferase [Candidatus Krumholzibacteria bacterium]